MPLVSSVRSVNPLKAAVVTGLRKLSTLKLKITEISEAESPETVSVRLLVTKLHVRRVFNVVTPAQLGEVLEII